MRINEFIQQAHQIAIDHGWHNGEERNFGEMIALMHSELTEALEEARAGAEPTYTYYECTKVGYDCYNLKCEICRCGKPCGIPSEFADLVIRVFDACGLYGIDLEAAIAEKMAFNRGRPYKHGKQF